MLCLHANAKINWTLDILGVREDGYHLMDMLMQSVTLHDTLRLEESDCLSLRVSGGETAADGGDAFSAGAVPDDDGNLVCRAAKALAAYAGREPKAAFWLQKRIPSGAGMGGGSADAAAALVGLNRLWGLNLSLEALQAVGLKLGADVPFMLQGGLARVGGIGEKLSPLSPVPRHWLALVKPCDGLSTREIFTAFDSLAPDAYRRPQTEAAQAALLNGRLEALGGAMANVLEAVSVLKRPAIREAARQLEALGAARAMMTGSGSVVYGVFADRQRAEAACRQLQKGASFCILTQTTDAGIEEA